MTKPIGPDLTEHEECPAVTEWRGFEVHCLVDRRDRHDHIAVVGRHVITWEWSSPAVPAQRVHAAGHEFIVA